MRSTRMLAMGYEFVGMNTDETANQRAQMEFKCPRCHSVIYSRRHKVCGSCGAALPKELLLTEAQIKELDRQRKMEKKRAREFQLPEDSSGSLV